MNNKFRYFILSCIILFSSCAASDDRYFKDGGALIWIKGPFEDSVIKSTVKHTIENSSIIIAQVAWSPSDSSFFENTSWYFSLAKEHGKKFMIAIDWQNIDRSGTIGDWSFVNNETASLFKRDMLRLLHTYNPDFMNLGVEINYYALTSPEGFVAFAKVFREIKEELKHLKPDLKIGLSYQLELLYGHHIGWNETRTLAPLDNLIGDIDYLGISTYPNMVSAENQSDLLFSTKYLDSINNKYNLPIGISETAVSGMLFNEKQREMYVNAIFQKARDLNLKFVVWGSMVDAFRDSIWSDKIGLLNKDGQPKKEFRIWQKENIKFYK
jgi:hypothetical protein